MARVLEADVIVRLTVEEMRQVAHVGVERRLRAISRSRQHRWAWDGEGVWNTDIQSAAAEMAVAKMLGRYWADTAEPDSAGDVGDRVQVRWTQRPDGCLILHPEDPDDHWFFLVVGQMPELDVRGHMQGKAGKQQRFWRDMARPAFFVPQAELTEYERKAA